MAMGTAATLLLPSTDGVDLPESIYDIERTAREANTTKAAAAADNGIDAGAVELDMRSAESNGGEYRQAGNRTATNNMESGDRRDD